MESLQSQPQKERAAKKIAVKEKSQKQEKIADAILYEAVARAIDHAPISQMPPFPHEFWIVKNPDGSRRIVEEIESGTKIVRDVCEGAVRSAIMHFTQKELRAAPDYRWVPRKCAEAARTWIDTGRELAQIEPCAQLSEDIWCYSRLAFDLKQDRTKMPIFDEFLSRCTNAEALCMFFGSLFDHDADRSQYLWMYGDGQNGKSQVMKLLKNCFGKAFAAEDANFAYGKFWTGGIVGKRVVVFSDSNSAKFVQSSLFKQLTGDDSIRVERKGEHPTTEPINMKFIFHSNRKPEITSEESNLRRCIFVEVAPLRCDPDPEYFDKLWAEAPYILGNCKANYDTKRGLKKSITIKVEKTALDLLAEEGEERYDYIFHKRFKIGTDGDCVSGQQMKDCLNSEKMLNHQDIRDFHAYIYRKYHIERKREKIGSVFHGILRKTDMEIAADQAATGIKLSSAERAQLHWKVGRQKEEAPPVVMEAPGLFTTVEEKPTPEEKYHSKHWPTETPW